MSTTVITTVATKRIKKNESSNLKKTTKGQKPTRAKSTKADEVIKPVTFDPKFAEDYARYDYFKLFGPSTVEERDRLAETVRCWREVLHKHVAPKQMSQRTKESLAYHEAGHAVVALMFGNLCLACGVEVPSTADACDDHLTSHGLAEYALSRDDEGAVVDGVRRIREAVMEHQAGSRAEAKFLGVEVAHIENGELNWSDRHDLLTAFRDQHRGAEPEDYMDEAWLLCVQEDLIALRVLQILDIPEVWTAVQHFASAVLESGSLWGASLQATIDSLPEGVLDKLHQLANDMNYGKDPIPLPNH